MNKAYEFCKANIDFNTTPKYVKKQMQDFMQVCEGKNEEYEISELKLNQLENILKILVMPKGLKAGQSLYECTCGYQWLFYTAILCTVYRDNPYKRRYETGVLEIARKNFKTFTVATIFLLLFVTEPKFSEFYSVAPNGALSRRIYDAMAETIRSSPAIYEYQNKKRFKILHDSISFLPTSTRYIPLSYSTSRMDGRMPNVFLADEAGDLPVSYPIEAMRSGQVNILNKLGMIISTKYPTIGNPFEDEVDYSKKVLDEVVKDDTRFSLLYEPDRTIGWETDDLVLKQANPAITENPAIWDDVVQKRTYAIAVSSARENFVCKHCNIIYQGEGTESYIDINAVRNCKVAKIDWTDRDVYIGLDLSETTDNTAVSMLAVDDDRTILAASWAFIPEEKVKEKTAEEKVDYLELSRSGKVIICGARIIDYTLIEDFIVSLEKKYEVRIRAIGYDRWNALASAQRLQKLGFNTIEIKQHSQVLHPPTKLLKEQILSEKFAYTENKLLEINFGNCRCTYDTNKNLYLTKKKSRGKIDMVAAMVNAMYLVQQDYFLNQMDFIAQIL